MILGPFSVIKRKSRICHCEHLKGAWQSDEVVARAKPVAISVYQAIIKRDCFVLLAMTSFPDLYRVIIFRVIPQLWGVRYAG